jgi:Mrp family chromosome partitioning ATPase
MSNADKPLQPFRDTRPTYAAAGAMGGLVVGFGSMILVGLLGRKLDGPEDARPELIGMPLLGVLPDLPEDLSDPNQAAIAAHSVHQIRTLLQIGGHGRQHQVFGITSPVAGTGKTSLALALGVSFAAAKQKTLLIDCDLVGGGLSARIDVIIRRKIGQILRREGLITEEQLNEALRLAHGSSRRLGEMLVELGYLEESELARAIVDQGKGTECLGMLDALSGEELQSCVSETGIEHLHVLPLGDASPQHAGALSPRAFDQLIRKARSEFDVIVVDTGPIPGSLEASIVTSQVDGVVLTVSRGEQSALVESSISYLMSVGGRIAGLVFNRAKDQDVVRFGSSGMTLARSTGSNRLSADAELAELSPESERLGPVARAVASCAPASRGSVRAR